MDTHAKIGWKGLAVAGVVLLALSVVPDASTGQPEVDYIFIMDAPNGGGQIVGSRAYYTGDVDVFYAAGYNWSDGFVGNVVVSWAVEDIQVFNISTFYGSSTSGRAEESGVTRVSATYDNGNVTNLTAYTGNLTVVSDIDYIVLEDLPDGRGSWFGAFVVESGSHFMLYAAGYNFTSGYRRDVPVYWSSTNSALCAVVSSKEPSTEVVTSGIGTCTITGTYEPKIVNSTGEITVVEGPPPPNQPPTCNILTPTNGATVAGSYTMSGAAADADGVVQSVEVRVDSGSWVLAVGTTSWAYLWDTTLVPDGYHTIFARSYDGFNYSDEAYVTVRVRNAGPGVPGPPVGLSASPGNALATLAWSPPVDDGGSAILNYTIWRGTTSGGETLLITVGPITSHVDIGLTNGIRYYYEVNAWNAVGPGPDSTEASATPATVPSEPLDLTAVGGDSRATLSWAAPAYDGGSPVANYRVYRGTVSGGETFIIEIGNNLTYVDTGLVNGQTYFYRISAVNRVGEGQRSEEAGATPSSPPTDVRSLLVESWFWILLVLIVSLLILCILFLLRRKKKIETEQKNAPETSGLENRLPSDEDSQLVTEGHPSADHLDVPL